MKVNTYFKYNLPFESWVATASDSGAVSYQYGKDDLGIVMAGGAGSMYLVAEDQLPTYSQVRNLKDASGQDILEVNGTTYPMYVFDATPQFDPFSNIVGWRHTLRKNPPTNLQDIVDGLDLGV